MRVLHQVVLNSILLLNREVFKICQLVDKIFSIKNQSSKLHKKYIVFTILGLKIKFQNPKNKILSFNTVQDGKLIKADSLMLAYNKQINEIIDRLSEAFNENLRTLKNEIYNQPLKEEQCDIIWYMVIDSRCIS